MKILTRLVLKSLVHGAFSPSTWMLMVGSSCFTIAWASSPLNPTTSGHSFLSDIRYVQNRIYLYKPKRKIRTVGHRFYPRSEIVTAVEKGRSNMSVILEEINEKATKFSLSSFGRYELFSSFCFSVSILEQQSEPSCSFLLTHPVQFKRVLQLDGLVVIVQEEVHENSRQFGLSGEVVLFFVGSGDELKGLDVLIGELFKKVLAITAEVLLRQWVLIIPLLEFQVGSNVDDQRRFVGYFVSWLRHFSDDVLKPAIVVKNPGVGQLGEMIIFKMKDYFAGNTVCVKELLYSGEALSFSNDEAHLIIFLLFCNRLLLVLRMGHIQRQGTDVRSFTNVVKQTCFVLQQPPVLFLNVFLRNVKPPHSQFNQFQHFLIAYQLCLP